MKLLFINNAENFIYSVTFSTKSEALGEIVLQ